MIDVGLVKEEILLLTYLKQSNLWRKRCMTLVDW